MRATVTSWVLVLTGALGLVGCGEGRPSVAVNSPVERSVTVTSTAFGHGRALPVRYTCDGEDVSPPLSWSGVPPGAAAVALVLDDPDAPSGTFTHWVVLDIPPTVTSTAVGAAPEGGAVGVNSAGKPGYFGPCPPSGRHHYRFTVYALSARTGLGEGADLSTALSAISRLTVGWGRLTTTYERR